MRIKRKNVHKCLARVCGYSEQEKDTDAGESLGLKTRYELQAGSPEEPRRWSLAFILSSDNIHFAYHMEKPGGLCHGLCLLFEPWF